MSIPTPGVLMLPVLRLCADKVWVMRDLIARISDDLDLSGLEREQTIASGNVPVIADRVHWAKAHLKASGLVVQPARGQVAITEHGREVLRRDPARIDAALLREFRGLLVRTKPDDTVAANTLASMPTALAEAGSTPEEQIASASLALDEALRDALMARVLEGTPAFFEGLIVDLLLAMGYGGSRADAGEQLGGTGDGGVDGVIREDQLGLDRIYLQAKRYQPGNSVGSEAVQSFMGALVGRGAQKGVLITTSSFTRAALGVAAQPGHLRLVLIDGDELTRLMVRFGVGMRVARTVEIRRVDLDYFDAAEPE